MLGIWLALAALCPPACTRCEKQVAPPATADFSSLRLDGTYFCDLAVGCEMTFDSATRATMIIPDATAGATQITYDVVYGASLEQTQKVTSSVDAGGQQENKNCGFTHNYRVETWIVPAVTFTATGASRNGQPLALSSSERILHVPASTLAQWRVLTHYIDRPSGDVYLGVLTESAAFSTFNVAITRTGARFSIGPP